MQAFCSQSSDCGHAFCLCMQGVTDGKTIYTCPMHPEVQSNKPGERPKCHMKLEPIKSE